MVDENNRDRGNKNDAADEERCVGCVIQSTGSRSLTRERQNRRRFEQASTLAVWNNLSVVSVDRIAEGLLPKFRNVVPGVFVVVLSDVLCSMMKRVVYIRCVVTTATAEKLCTNKLFV
jgi:hypothetical protein